MKKSILLICLLILSLFSFSQEFEEVGTFIEGNDPKMDSIVISELITKFNIDTTGYEFIQFYGDFDKNLDLHKRNFGLSYSLIITNESKNFYSSTFNEGKEKLNKYILINEHRFYNGRREINITIF